jgi:hypothetical protein
MCGRYYSRAEKQRIAEAFRAGIPDHLDFLRSYNVAPQSIQPIIRLSTETEECEIALMRWGLIPFWAKGAKIGLSTINARAETVTTSPAFRKALKRRRCLVPASGFYEWQKLDAKAKQPYAISVTGQDPIAFAGAAFVLGFSPCCVCSCQPPPLRLGPEPIPARGRVGRYTASLTTPALSSPFFQHFCMHSEKSAISL